MPSSLRRARVSLPILSSAYDLAWMPGKGPRRKGCLRGLYGQLYLRGVALGVIADHVRQLEWVQVGSVSSNPLAVNKVLVKIGHECL